MWFLDPNSNHLGYLQLLRTLKQILLTPWLCRLKQLLCQFSLSGETESVVSRGFISDVLTIKSNVQSNAFTRPQLSISARLFCAHPSEQIILDILPSIGTHFIFAHVYSYYRTQQIVSNFSPAFGRKDKCTLIVKCLVQPPVISPNSMINIPAWLGPTCMLISMGKGNKLLPKSSGCSLSPTETKDQAF